MIVPSSIEKGYIMTAVTAPTHPSTLTDNFGRRISYLRLSITDRCNLRCRYCMPEDGVRFLDHNDILSYEELERLVAISLKLGIEKFRITGGEPFARKGCMGFLERMKVEHGVRKLFITTNGVAVAPHLSDLKRIGISGINLSLDTMNRERFVEITRRDQFDNVIAVFHESVRRGIPLKVNSVIQAETTDSEIVALAELIADNPVSLRFIELMPFSGKQRHEQLRSISLESRLQNLFPGMTEISSNVIETARRFSVPGAKGTLGIIEGHSRKFCSTCNKIRITSQGMLKTCLYDHGVLDLRDMLRAGADNGEITTAIVDVVGKRHEDGKTAEQVTMIDPEHESMATIGG